MILITGAAGYIGSHCVLEFIQNGLDVVLFDNFSTGHKLTIETLKKLDKDNHIKAFVEGDLRNPSDIKQVFSDYKIDAVIHFAAFSQVAESMHNPNKYFNNNVQGSKNLLDAMIENGVKNIVFSSTAAVYGEPEYIPIDEIHPTKPINTYGYTKLEVENIMDDYDEKYGVKSIRLRYFNVVGASSSGMLGEVHEPETHLVPNVLKAALGEGNEFKLFGTSYDTKDGTCVRDYINVEDLVYAHRLALDYLLKNQKTDVFNLGTAEGNTVKEVFAACEKITGCKIPLVECPAREGDPAKLIASNLKAQGILNWSPENSLEESIKTAWEWEQKSN